jgi:hypothetical protein
MTQRQPIHAEQLPRPELSLDPLRTNPVPDLSFSNQPFGPINGAVSERLQITITLDAELGATLDQLARLSGLDADLLVARGVLAETVFKEAIYACEDFSEQRGEFRWPPRFNLVKGTLRSALREGLNQKIDDLLSQVEE